MSDEEKTFSQADIDALETKHAEELNALKTRLNAEFKRKTEATVKEMERKALEANMSELEKAQNSAKEWEAKFNESNAKIEIANQKDETRALMKELGVDEKCLDFCFIPKDCEGTKARVKAFKEYVDSVKKETFETNLKSTIPKKGQPTQDDGLRKAMGL